VAFVLPLLILQELVLVLVLPTRMKRSLLGPLERQAESQMAVRSAAQSEQGADECRSDDQTPPLAG